MDANRDHRNKTSGNEELENFIQTAGLVDHYQDMFPEPVQIYAHGPERLYYIPVDPGIVGSIEHIGNIGYLITHEGWSSDHVYAYVDFNLTKLFQELTNRPVAAHSWEFMITQKDKKLAFQKH